MCSTMYWKAKSRCARRVVSEEREEGGICGGKLWLYGRLRGSFRSSETHKSSAEAEVQQINYSLRGPGEVACLDVPVQNAGPVKVMYCLREHSFSNCQQHHYLY